MLKIENLSFSYTGSPPYILNDISLNIRAGEYVSVIGDNGSGKSTLIRLILKFLAPTAGTIEIQAKRTGYVPQRSDFSNSDFPITVYEMLNSYRKLLKIKGREAVSESLKQVGMPEYKDALMGTLSAGQSQKIVIARALTGNPDLLILDEPSTGVDAGSQKEIYGLLRSINREKGVTIVSVEHNLEAAVINSTLIYHLSGRHGHLCTPAQYAAEYLTDNAGHLAYRKKEDGGVTV
jgi:zinc transport system ATP-binding protein